MWLPELSLEQAEILGAERSFCKASPTFWFKYEVNFPEEGNVSVTCIIHPCPSWRGDSIIINRIIIII